MQAGSAHLLRLMMPGMAVCARCACDMKTGSQFKSGKVKLKVARHPCGVPEMQPCAFVPKDP